MTVRPQLYYQRLFLLLFLFAWLAFSGKAGVVMIPKAITRTHYDDNQFLR